MPHFSLPFRADGGRIALSDDDSTREITDCATNVLRTPVGWLEWQPDLGRPDYAFTSGGVDPAQISDLIAAWEERATPEIAEQLVGLADELAVTEVSNLG